MKLKKIPTIIKVALTVIMLTATLLICCSCGSGENNIETGNKDKFQIITSFYPIYIATINVTRGLKDVNVVNMTRSQVGCLHDYQLTPWDLKLIESGDAFVINGAGMETFVDSLVSQNPEIRIVNASDGIKLIEDSNGRKNAHVFVSVANEILQVENIARQLSILNPKNKEAYMKNSKEYVKKLEALGVKMHAALANIKSTRIVTFHEAFPYFAKEFGLTIAAVIEREPGATPTPKELVQTINIINDNKITSIFVEPQYPIRTANIIAQETGAKVFVLDPMVTGNAKPDAYDDYILRMEKNLSVLEETLSQ